MGTHKPFVNYLSWPSIYSAPLLSDATGTPKTSPLSLTTTVAQTIVVPVGAVKVLFSAAATNVDATAFIKIYVGASATGGFYELYTGKSVEFDINGFQTTGYPTQFTLVNSASATHKVSFAFGSMSADGS